MKDTLKITAEYIYDPDLDLEVRTAALYTLYGLYYHQMNRPRTKVAFISTQIFLRSFLIASFLDSSHSKSMDSIFTIH